MSTDSTSGPPYGDSHEERARELAETGTSIRYTGRPIMTLIAEALGPDPDAPADQEDPR